MRPLLDLEAGSAAVMGLAEEASADVIALETDSGAASVIGLNFVLT